MRRFFNLVAAMFAATSLSAQSTPDALRDMMYAGDVHGLEAAFASDHALSLAGEMSFEDLRRLHRAVVTSHPDFYATVDAWLEAYPQSPYPMTVRSRQYVFAGWAVRGSGPGNVISRDAHALFGDYLWAATDWAMLAFETAPDYVLASDALFRVQRVTKPLSVRDYRAAVARVMDETPNPVSLRLAATVAEPGWGGGGLAEVEYYCRSFSDRVPDTTYTHDVCMIHLGHNIGLSSAEFNQLWDGYEGGSHPAIAHEWVLHVMSPQYDGDSDTALQIVEAYLQGEGETDRKVAREYFLRFPNHARAHPETLDHVNEQLRQVAERAIVHDPFNLELLEFLIPDYGVDNTERYSENSLILKQRMAWASPFRAENWYQVARHYKWNEQGFLDGTIDLYYQNGLSYGDHRTDLLTEYLMHKTDLYDLLSADEELSSSADVTTLAMCPIARLDRLLTYSCEVRGQPAAECPRIRHNLPGYLDIVARAASEGLCKEELTAPISELFFEPQDVDWEQVMRPLVFD